MRYDFKVQVEDSHGVWRSILYTNDEYVAALTARTRERGVSSRVIDAQDNVTFENPSPETQEAK